MEIDRAGTSVTEVQRLHPIEDLNISEKGPGRFLKCHGNPSRKGTEFRICRNLHNTHSPAAESQGNPAHIPEVKILKTRHGSVPDVGDVLVTLFHPVLSGLGEIGMCFQPLSGPGSVVTAHTVLTPQVAGNPGFIFALSF